MNCPDWVRQEWQTRDKGETAQMLMDCNWDKARLTTLQPFHVDPSSALFPLLWQDLFMNRLEIMVKKSKSVKVIVDERWMSEKDMKEEGWSANLVRP